MNTLCYNLKDVCTRLGETEEKVAELVKTGRLELTDGGFITDQTVSNFIVERRIDAERAAADLASDRRLEHGLQLLRENKILQEVVREALPKLLAESRKRIAKDGYEPLPDLGGRLQAIAEAQ